MVCYVSSFTLAYSGQGGDLSQQVQESDGDASLGAESCSSHVVQSPRVD